MTGNILYVNIYFKGKYDRFVLCDKICKLVLENWNIFIYNMNNPLNALMYSFCPI